MVSGCYELIKYENKQVVNLSTLNVLIFSFNQIIYSIKSFINCYYLSVRGKTILLHMRNEFSESIDKKYERKVGLYITLIQMILNILILLSIFLSGIIKIFIFILTLYQ